MCIAETCLCIVQQLNSNRFSIKKKKKSQISEKKKYIWTINYDSLNKNTIAIVKNEI
jgi:hypothetical protein